MRTLVLIILTITLFSCAKKEVKLPTLATKGVQEIHNHSQIWFFFNALDTDTIVKVNARNTISTTHWIFNIDKRLPLKLIIPNISKLQEKHSKSLHASDNMHNYFSYADTISKQLSFLEFDNVNYKTDSLISKLYIKKNNEDYKNFNNINITINPKNNWINDSKIEKNEFKTTLQEFIDFSSEEKLTMLHLNFNQNIVYQEYLYYKTFLESLKSTSILTNKTEFIFNPNKVPECDCE